MTDPPQPSQETVYYPNGRLKYTGHRLDGEMHGSWRWYRIDGSLMRTGAFDRGRQVGVWCTFDRADRVVKETDFGQPEEPPEDPL